MTVMRRVSASRREKIEKYMVEILLGVFVQCSQHACRTKEGQVYVVESA